MLITVKSNIAAIDFLKSTRINEELYIFQVKNIWTYLSEKLYLRCHFIKSLGVLYYYNVINVIHNVL